MDPSVNRFLNNNGDNRVKVFECFHDLSNNTVSVVNIASASLAAKAATKTYDEARTRSRTNHVDAMIANGMKLAYEGNDFLLPNVEHANTRRGPLTDELLVSRQLYRTSEHIIKSKERMPCVGVNIRDEKALRQVGSYFCPICLGLFKNPISTRCGHIFCKECIKLHLNVHAPRANKCPVCRQLITKRTNIRVFLPDVDFRCLEA